MFDRQKMEESLYNDRMLYLFEQGMEKGLERGVEQGQIKIARNMIAIGMSTEEISKITGLPVDKVLKLRT